MDVQDVPISTGIEQDLRRQIDILYQEKQRLISQLHIITKTQMLEGNKAIIYDIGEKTDDKKKIGIKGKYEVESIISASTGKKI